MKQIKVLNRTIQITPTKIFFVGIFVLLILSIYLRMITPQYSEVPNVERIPKITPLKQFDGLAEKADIEISVKLPKLPKEIYVYKSETALSLPTLAQIMAQSMAMNPVADRGFVWTSAENPSTIVYSQYLQKITYTKIVEYSSEPISKDKAVETAVNFVKTNIKIDNLKPNLSSIITSNHNQEENHNLSNLQTGSLHVVPFYQKIGEYDLFFNNSDASPVQVWVGPEYQVVKASIDGIIPDFSEHKLEKTITEQEIINAVKSGQGTLLFISDKSAGVPVDHQVVSIDLNEVKIEYRSYGDSGVIYPYLNFTGKALLKNNNVVRVGIIYPIVRTIMD